MFANLTVTTGQSGDVLTLPRTAIVYSLYGDNVFVVTPAPQGGAHAAAGDKGGAQTAIADKGSAPSLIVERRFVRLGASARREGCDRRGGEGGRAGGDRRPDQAAGQYASHNRRERRASGAGGNAKTVTARR